MAYHISQILCLCCVVSKYIAINTTTPASASNAKIQSQNMIWMDKPEPVIINWSYGNDTCYTMNECFGVTDNGVDDMNTSPQLQPLVIQPNTKLIFTSTGTQGLRVYNVTMQQFESCYITIGMKTIPLANNSKNQLNIDSEYLSQLHNYFIVDSSDPLFRCEFGLRINVTIKESRCHGDSPIGNHSNRTPCSGRGDCSSTLAETEFTCKCEQGFTGSTCDLLVQTTPVPKNCRLSGCSRHGFCHRNSTCQCDDGFAGEECEVNINECKSNPCTYGICIDRENEYQCFCKPGWSGENCDKRYSICTGDICDNNGVCVDTRYGEFECKCTPGFAGPLCRTKVHLCASSPCLFAYECIEHTNHIKCICKPGYVGEFCEINVNECESDPCQNGGVCYDRVAGFECECDSTCLGILCEILDGEDTTSTAVINYKYSKLTKLMIILGTLLCSILSCVTFMMLYNRKVIISRIFKQNKKECLESEIQPEIENVETIKKNVRIMEPLKSVDKLYRIRRHNHAKKYIYI